MINTTMTGETKGNSGEKPRQNMTDEEWVEFLEWFELVGQGINDSLEDLSENKPDPLSTSEEKLKHYGKVAFNQGRQKQQEIVAERLTENLEVKPVGE